MSPATHTGPGTISMKVEYVQGAPPYLHTQTSFAGTRDNTWRRAYMPATIVIARGLLSPMPVYGWRFSAVGERVNILTLHFRVRVMSHPPVSPLFARNTSTVGVEISMTGCRYNC